MLYTFGFDRLALLVGDLYFQDPDPAEGQEGPERGVRLELRRIEAGELMGSIYSARPIAIAEPLWRVDLLESAAGPQGSFDRTHHHPKFTGWDQSERVFEEELFAEPLGWLERKLSNLPAVLTRAGAAADTASPDDLAGLRLAMRQILDATRWLLGRVWAGELGRPPAVPTTGLIRSSWL
jgi:hypothetical protein